jgi:hypothetical protein
MVKEKQLSQQKREELEREVAAVEKKQNEIEYYLSGKNFECVNITRFIDYLDISRKHCFLSLQINSGVTRGGHGWAPPHHHQSLPYQQGKSIYNFH